MNQGTDRIPCPRCRANNFPGKPNCWQCGGSLPPPEALRQAAGPPPPQGYPQPMFHPPFSGGRKRASWIVVVPVLLILLFVTGGLFAYVARMRTANPGSGLDALQALRKQMEGRIQQEVSRDAESSEPDDPLEQRAKRELGRLYEKRGYTPPPADADGNIHLRTGGTVTQEQWNRALDAVGDDR
jgi:hypothetical protein